MSRTRPWPAGPSKRRHATPGGRYPLQQPPRRPLELRGRRCDLRKTKDDCHARRYTPQCTFYSARPLHPAIRGEDDGFSFLPCMYTAPPCVYKRGRRALSQGDVRLDIIQHSAPLTEHIRSSEPRYWHSPQSTPPLAETWELPSLSRLTCKVVPPTTGTPGARQCSALAHPFAGRTAPRPELG